MEPDGSRMRGAAAENGGAGRVDLAHVRDFRLGAMEVRPSSREVLIGTVREALEPRVMQVLVALARAPGTVVSRDDLFECCWEGRIVGEDAMNRVISKLRRLSEQAGGGSFTIETIPRVGYRLWPAEGAEPEPPAPEAAAPLSSPARSGALSPRRLVIAAGAIVLLAAAAAFAVSRLSPDARAAEPALAVLPFDDLSPGGGQAYFSEGVAEEILSELASHGVKVIGRTSARQFAEGDADLPTLRRALAVSHVLEGSVRSAGGRTRVVVRLVQTSDGSQVWAEEFDRDAGDIFAVQDQIGATVARRLSGRLGGRGQGEPAGPAAAAEVDAYNLYLAGRARLRERTEPALNAAEGLFARAVKLDPQSAPAWAALAETKALLMRRMPATEGERIDRVQEEARRLAMHAIKLAPERAEGYVALGQVERGDAPSRAIKPLETALKLDPSRSDARIWLGNAYTAEGRYREGLDQIRVAYTSEPLWFNANDNLVAMLSSFGLTAEADAVIRRWEANAAQPDKAAELRADLAFDRGDLSEALKWRRAASGDLRGPEIGHLYAALRMSERARSAVPAVEARIQDLFHARDLAGMQRAVQKQGPGLWTLPGDAWFAAMLFNASGRSDLTYALYSERFPTPQAFCAWATKSPEAAASFAYALIKAGQPGPAKTILDCSEPPIRRWLGTGFMKNYNEIELAQIAALRGQREAALAGIERAVANGWMGQHTTLSDLRLHMAFESLFAEPRFRVAAARVDGAVEHERREALAVVP